MQKKTMAAIARERERERESGGVLVLLI